MLCFVTLAIRLVGIDHGLPHHLEPDGEIGTQIEQLRGARSKPHRESSVATYPMLVAYLTAAAFEAPPPPEAAGPRPLAEHLAIAAKPFRDARLTVALLSILIVPGTFWLARQFLTPGWSLAAAGFAAFSVLDLTFAQQCRPHAVIGAFAPWALAAAIAVRRRGDTLAYAAAGVAIGLALAGLQSGVALLLPFAAAHCARERRRLLDPRMLVTVALIGAFVLAFYRFPSAEGGSGGIGLTISGERVIMGNHYIGFSGFNGDGLRIVLRTLWWYEPGLLALALAASSVWIASLLRSRAGALSSRRDAWVVAAFVVPYLLVLSAFEGTYERFLVPALPPLGVFAMWGAREVALRPAVRRWMLAAVAAALCVHAACSARLAWLRSRPDTIELAARWLAENVAPGSERIFLSPIATDVPLGRTQASLSGPGGPRARYHNLWSKYQAHLADGAMPPPLYDVEWVVLGGPEAKAPPGVSAAEYLRSHPRAMLAPSGPGLYVVEDHRTRPGFELQNVLQDALAALGERIAVFAPDETANGFKYQDGDGELGPELGERRPVAYRCLTARAIGPVVEIWRVRPEQSAR